MGPNAIPIEAEHRQQRLLREADAHRLAMHARPRDGERTTGSARLRALATAAVTIVVLVAVRGLPTG